MKRSTAGLANNGVNVMSHSEILTEAKRLKKSNPSISKEELRDALEHRFLSSSDSSVMSQHSFMPREKFGVLRVVYHSFRWLFSAKIEDREKIKEDIHNIIAKLYGRW